MAELIIYFPESIQGLQQSQIVEKLARRVKGHTVRTEPSEVEAIEILALISNVSGLQFTISQIIENVLLHSDFDLNLCTEKAEWQYRNGVWQ